MYFIINRDDNDNDNDNHNADDDDDDGNVAYMRQYSVLQC